MSENNICAICGGYIGNAILAQTLTSGSASIAPIKFCPGHSMTDAALYRTFTVGHFPIMCTGVGPELVTLPTGSSVYPNNYLQQQETLWQIAREVDEIDSTCDGEEDIHGVPVNHFCPFCGNEQIHADRKDGKEFLHRDNCIVITARKLMEWRKVQPRVEVKVVQGEVDFDETLRHKAHLITKAFEIPPQLVGELDGEVPRD